MKTTTIDRLVWALIYLGIIVVGAGLALLRFDAVLGWSGLSAGAALIAAGAVAIVVRSRMKEIR